MANNQRGSALLEATVASGAIVAIVTAGLSVASICFARLWLQRVAYEGAYCLAVDGNKSSCEQRMRFEIEAALSFGDLKTVKLKKTARESKIEIVWEFLHEVPIRIERAIQLPLRGTNK